MQEQLRNNQMQNVQKMVPQWAIKNYPTLFSSQSGTSSIEMSRIIGEVSATHETQNKQFISLTLERVRRDRNLNSFESHGSELSDTTHRWDLGKSSQIINRWDCCRITFFWHCLLWMETPMIIIISIVDNFLQNR